ncbi:nucleotidyltransferase domain-containing protein [Candidatus Pacearchaeota archaeon]|nr:nucleotidyltransferase domain-containing protein [Candidatus Pacearchaeota archaeon]
MVLTKEQKIIIILFKEKLGFYNSRSMSKIVGISHPGAFKILKKLEKNFIVSSKRIGKAIIFSLNFENPMTKNLVENALIAESQEYKRWVEEFKEIEEISLFAILFGSIIKNENSAKDIDLLVVSEQNYQSIIQKIINGKNKISNKKIHLILQIGEDFLNDLHKNNKVILEIIKTGIVLFGQDKFIKLIK